MSYSGTDPVLQSTIIQDQTTTAVTSPPANYRKIIDRSGMMMSVNSSGVQTPVAVGLGNPLVTSNYSLSASVAGNALTVSLKDSAGNNPSTSSPVHLGIRSATLTSGLYNVRSVTSTLSVTVSSGSTLGHASGVKQYIYVYALDNAGTVELAVSSSIFDDGAIVSTTAEGGAGAATSASVMYSTTARSNVGVRLIGRLASNQTAAGTWAAAPTEINSSILSDRQTVGFYANTSSTSIANSGNTIPKYTNTVLDTHTCYSAVTGLYTVPRSGMYVFSAGVAFASASWTAANNLQLVMSIAGALSQQIAYLQVQTTQTSLYDLYGSMPVYLKTGQTVNPTVLQSSSGAKSLSGVANENHFSLVYCGAV